MQKPQVLLMAAVPHMLIERLEKSYQLHRFIPGQNQEALAFVAPDIQAIVANGESRVTADFLARFPAVRILAVFGVGYDGVDVGAARAQGISVTHTPDVLTDDVADLAIALMLSAARAVPAADRFVRAGKWLEGGFPLSRKVSGSRLGIVGLGRIGLAIAQRAAGFQMETSYWARQPKPLVPYAYYPSLQALASSVDILIVSTVGGQPTRGLVNAEVLDALGPHGILVNVARGSVVDEKALVRALMNKNIAGAGLDVFTDEPRVSEDLLGMDNVVLTPHIASATLETRIAMSDMVMQNLAAHFEGKPLISQVPYE
jgi:lactate dehydrogenase-like 2-hydroxyacid dehydrogenase